MEEKLKNINFEKEVDNWLEEFSDINSELWDYVHANNLQNEWVKDKPDLYKRVTSSNRYEKGYIELKIEGNIKYHPFFLIKISRNGNRDKEKRKEMGKLAGTYADFTIITTDNPRDEKPETIAKEIEAGLKETRGLSKVIINRKDAIEFAIQISDLCDEIKGCSVYVSQIVRSSSSIGANIHEAKYAQSKADFINKLEISLKECSETEYWLELIFRKGKMPEPTYKDLRNKCGSIRRRLIASITTAKENK